LLAHDLIEFMEAQPTLLIAELPIARNAHEVAVCQMQLRLKGLQVRR
jgi:hypothetical protein